MEREQAERFVAAAEEDFAAWVAAYIRMMTLGQEEEEVVAVVRAARAEVLAAQQVLLLAREERRVAERRAEEEAACPNCGRVVGRAYLFDSWARGVEWCADCDADAAREAGR